MRRIGLLGGMSWESTLTYYRFINEGVREALGGLSSADLVLRSFDFAPLERLQHAGCWDEILHTLLEGGHQLVASGAEAVFLCTNTMHAVADDLAVGLPVPLIHIADPVGEFCARRGLTRVGLLGTEFTMSGGFYHARLAELFAVQCLVLDRAARAEVHRVIYEELCQGRVLDGSRKFYGEQISALAAQGAQAVILGCTEIGLLLEPETSLLPLLDTTRMHCRAAVDFLLGE